MGGVGGYIAGLSAVGSTFTVQSAYFSGASITLPATTGQQALAAGVSVASSYLPGVSIPIGDNFSIGLSPAMFVGTGGLGLGGNVGVGFHSENVDFGLSLGGTAWSKHVFTGGKFFESRFGAQMAIGAPGFKVGLATSSFGGGGIGQRTGSFVGYGNGWGIRYENDWLWGLPTGDGGDRWRTTGVSIQVGEHSLSLNMATGDPGPDGSRQSDMINGIDTYTGKNANDYRLSVLSVGFRGYHWGINSEKVRDTFQNRLAHKNGSKYPIFTVMNQNVRVFGAYKRSNYYTTW